MCGPDIREPQRHPIQDLQDWQQTVYWSPTFLEESLSWRYVGFILLRRHTDLMDEMSLTNLMCIVKAVCQKLLPFAIFYTLPFIA